MNGVHDGTLRALASVWGPMEGSFQGHIWTRGEVLSRIEAPDVETGSDRLPQALVLVGVPPRRLCECAEWTREQRNHDQRVRLAALDADSLVVANEFVAIVLDRVTGEPYASVRLIGP